MWRAITGAAISAFVCGVALGQGADSHMSFEVASVKLSGPQSVRGSNGGPGTRDPERFTFAKAVLRDLLYRAYAVDDPYAQISGPAWIDTQEYDIAVKIPTGASKEQFQGMLRNMLAERFKLVVHHDTKVLPVYELVVAKNGPKLKKSTPIPVTDPPPAPPKPFAEDENGFPQLPPGRATWTMMNRSGRSRLAAQQQSASTLSTILRVPLGRPIIDKTELTGLYDFTLEFDPRAATGGTSVDGQDPGAPDIFIAIQQQLGLKLVDAKAPFDVVVVDQAEKVPTEN